MHIYEKKIKSIGCYFIVLLSIVTTNILYFLLKNQVRSLFVDQTKSLSYAAPF